MKAKLGIATFLKLYANDNACLEKIFHLRYGKQECCPACTTPNAKFYRVKNRRCYECGLCKYQIYPLAGTVIHGSITPLSKWFFAIFLFSVSKNGISANELARVLEISYKTAWRMAHLIRIAMREDEFPPMHTDIEVDEAMIGGKCEGKRGWGAGNKTIVFGMTQRGGRVKTFIVPNREGDTLIPIIAKNSRKGSLIHSDKYRVYKQVKVNGYRQLVKGTKGVANTNHIEGYWSNLKKSIFGTHTWVTPKHLSKYLAEFDFRYTYRHENDLFNKILERI